MQQYHNSCHFRIIFVICRVKTVETIITSAILSINIKIRQLSKTHLEAIMIWFTTVFLIDIS